MSAKTEIALYRVLAVAALAGTWTFNIRLMLAGGTMLDFLKQGYANNPTASLSTDVGLCALLLVFWMAREARRYGIKHLWAYILFSFLVAISVTVPLFLAARRKAVEAQGEKHGVTTLTAAYPLFGGVSFVLVNYFVYRFALEGLPLSWFVTAWFESSGAASLAVDLLALSAALLVFLFAEARRGHVRRFAVYVVMCVFGVAFALPWFLRELDVRHEQA